MAVPVLKYGSENWSLNWSDKRKIEAAKMRLLRPMAGYALWDSKSSAIWELLGIFNIINKLTQYKINWREHIQRMDENRLPKKINKLQTWREKKYRKTTNEMGRRFPGGRNRSRGLSLIDDDDDDDEEELGNRARIAKLSTTPAVKVKPNLSRWSDLIIGEIVVKEEKKKKKKKKNEKKKKKKRTNEWLKIIMFSRRQEVYLLSSIRLPTSSGTLWLQV